MKKLTSKEQLILALALASVVTSLVAVVLHMETLYRVSFLVFLGTLLAGLAILLVRLDRLSSQQTKSRREVYQVLYSLHGTEKTILEQGAELQRMQAEQVQSLSHLATNKIEKTLQRSLGNQAGKLNDPAAENAKKLLQRNNKKIDNAVEAQRIQMNRLFAVLDAHWDKLTD